MSIPQGSDRDDGETWVRRYFDDSVRLIALLFGTVLIVFVLWRVVQAEAGSLKDLGQIYVYLFGAALLAFVVPRLTKFSLWDKGPSAELESKVTEIKKIVEGVDALVKHTRP